MIRIVELLIDGVDYSEYATIPLQTQDTLDESLDVAYIELKGLERENPFLPFSDVYLKIKDDNRNTTEHYMFVESDTPTEIIPLKRYDHNVLLIEETKWAERFFIEKSITNPLVHDYVAGATGLNADTIYNFSTDNASVEVFLKDNLQIGYLYSPARVNHTVTIPHKVFDDSGLLDWKFFSGELQIRKPDGEQQSIILNENEAIDFEYNQIGKYEFYFNYNLRQSTGISTEYAYCRFSFDVNVIEQVQKKEDKTIKDAINILLETTQTLRKSETPIFKLAQIEDYVNVNEIYRERIKKIFQSKSPEFYFSKMSLFEALKMIGNYSHFIPRIKQRKIYLDLLGMDDLASAIQLEDYYSYTSSQSTNDFCTKLDSQVNNLVNLDSEEQGSVVTPFNNGYRTLRTESGIVQITEQNIIIPTESPIEKIIKLEIGYIEGYDKEVGDITPYVYESAEYGLLSSYSNVFPYSKMFALEYSTGSPNIKSLSFERTNAINQAFEGIAIKNIINKKINGSTDSWSNLFDNKDAFKFQYRLTYIPSTTTRVIQSKAYKENINKTISIAYNQSASKISSNAYGENLKGQILKMGNIEKQKMYVLPSLDLIPICGQKFDDDYYISVVKCEYYPTFIKCEVGLSKDYNNKSAYVEIDSQLRFYEISEKVSYDIYRIYEDYCEIGIDNESDKKSLITNDGLDKFSQCFHYGYSDVNLTMVTANNVVLPVVSLGLGNSLLFEYHYKDNFSAGEIAKYDSGVRVQDQVSYTDDWGELEYLNLKYGKNNTITLNYEQSVAMGDNLPLADVVQEMDTYFDTLDDPIKLCKDSREAIHFTYQIHFVANNNNIIIGSGLARYSPFVTNETLNYKLVLLKERLNKFESEIDLTNSYSYDSILLDKDYENKKVKLKNVVAPLEDEHWRSWAIVQTIKNDEGEIAKAILILGENKDIKSGDIIEMPNFVFKHKIVEE